MVTLLHSNHVFSAKSSCVTLGAERNGMVAKWHGKINQSLTRNIR